ncbi:carboxypeptidase-like regulatory domain-containing protein [Chryseobacterium sp. LC2016-29]|uniref:carboxypeptidase-like regulatory domain-containing protein n=1 Tax=Chryseobacterium sp. LC2016-29 TaxID=2897331 RepID=UPI001E62711D|nr:carboxypeptidase-like regulatory domain-containing protein [Chryseobacterium sp. LC2016-29]MCD0479610.1 carboxypeptidase-like regulatory domain-containing protein [Chryseobacterium sp. LC2016-29]
MRTVSTKFLIVIALLQIIFTFSQQQISGKIVDEDHNNLIAVLIFNTTQNIKTYSNISGEFSIEADENDEVKFIKEGFYRLDKIIKKETFNSQLQIQLARAEALIQEVKIDYKPSGNLAKDSKRLDDPKKVASLKSELNDYMKSELNEPLPKNEISKTFKGHDFQAGHASVNLLTIFGEVSGLIKKATGTKITTPNYVETQNFLAKVKAEVNLTMFEKYGMDEEKIDYFLAYAEKVNHLSKKYRKDFNAAIILSELQNAFGEFSKLNKLSE